jgi:hypothetical protein
MTIENNRLDQAPKLFRIHCSQIHKIMGDVGLTENQLQTMHELQARKDDSGAKPLTANMESTLSDLINRYNNPDLPVGCQTFLKEWYAGDYEEIYSKYTNKGNIVEQDCIDFMARVLGFGLADKNKIQMSDEFLIGECDVDFLDLIVDVKSPWNRKTLHDAIGGINPEHEWQGRGYMRLYRKPRFIVFHGLMDTPATDYEDEVIYSDLPDNERWIAYEIERDEAIESKIIGRVLECREWLTEYDKLVKSRMGRVLR